MPYAFLVGRTALIRDLFSYGFPRKLHAGPYGHMIKRVILLTYIKGNAEKSVRRINISIWGRRCSKIQYNTVFCFYFAVASFNLCFLSTLLYAHFSFKLEIDIHLRKGPVPIKRRFFFMSSSLSYYVLKLKGKKF